MIRVHALAPYPASGPSTRFRLAQFVQPLADLGVELHIDPFLSEEDYARHYDDGTPGRAAALVRGLRRRRRALAGPASPDVWLVHRELAPVGASLLLPHLRRSAAPFVFDFDDAVYLMPPGGRRALAWARRPAEAASRLARGAVAVLAGNEALASWARAARGTTDEAVDVVPTVVDTDRFVPATKGPAGSEPVIGWVGTHSTMPYLDRILPALASLRAEVPLRLRVVSNRPPLRTAVGDLNVEFTPWSAEAEVRLTQALDVGLYPLDDTPWSRGKCGFKAIQYMACGVPVVASGVGVLPEVLGNGEAGLLVPPGGDWREPLGRLLRDSGLRARLGRTGRGRVESTYSVHAVAPTLARILRGVAAVAPADAGASATGKRR